MELKALVLKTYLLHGAVIHVLLLKLQLKSPVEELFNPMLPIQQVNGNRERGVAAITLRSSFMLGFVLVVQLAPFTARSMRARTACSAAYVLVPA
jgi:hypothetical protein